MRERRLLGRTPEVMGVNWRTAGIGASRSLPRGNREGPLTEPTAGAQPRAPEGLLMPKADGLAAERLPLSNLS